jgi:16S rRNA (guanine966-N2)-methyltransferase
MRVSGGVLRGRVVRVPKAGVRPTQDSVREAVFSMLQPVLAGRRFLDLYAGTGVVGLEAASRGAGCVWWVEQHAHTYALLKSTIEELTPGLGATPPELRCVRANVAVFLKKSLASAPFDIIFADPPYGSPGDPESGAGADDTAEGLLRAVGEAGMLTPGGLFVLETRVSRTQAAVAGWDMIRERHYGKTLVRVYRQIGAD